MTQPPQNGPDAETQPFGAVPPEPQPVVIHPAPEPAPPAASGSNTRTILEIVGGVIAVVAIFAAGVFGFGLGWFAGTHNDKSNDGVPRMMMRFDDGLGGSDGNDDQQAPDLRDFFGGPGGDSSGSGGSQSMPDLPDDLQRLLEQFGEQFGQGRGDGQGMPGFGGGQDDQSVPASPAPAPSS